MVNKIVTSKVVSKTTEFKSKYFRIEKTVLNRMGKQFTKSIISWYPIVFIIPLTKKKEVYLEIQYRDAYQKSLLEVVAGHAEPGEDTLIAAKRELKEETGLSADKWSKIGVIHPSANIRSDINIYVARKLVVPQRQY